MCYKITQSGYCKEPKLRWNCRFKVHIKRFSQIVVNVFRGSGGLVVFTLNLCTRRRREVSFTPRQFWPQRKIPQCPLWVGSKAGLILPSTIRNSCTIFFSIQLYIKHCGWYSVIKQWKRKFSLYLITHHTVKTYGYVNVLLMVSFKLRPFYYLEN